MTGNLTASILLQFRAEQARREMAAAGGDLRGLGMAAEEAGRKGATAGAAIAQTGTAAKMAAQPVAVLARETANTVSQQISLTAQMGRSATAMGGVMNAATGLTRSIKDQVEAMRAESREAALLKSELDEVRARFNPLFAASRQYEMALRDIADAERMGAISAQEAAAARDRAAQSMAPMNSALVGNAGATNAATAASANLFAQWNDIGMMMAAGQNPLQLAMQQGTQVSQVLMGMGGGATALRAIGSSFLALLNPVSLATIGIIAFGAAGVQWLMSLGGEAKTFQDDLDALTDTLGRMKTNLDLVGDTRLSETFGSLTDDVRGLAQGMLELDRAAELKQLGTVVDAFLNTETAPTFSQRFFQAYNPGGAMGAPPVTDDQLAASRYSELGAANSYADFTSRTGSIQGMAEVGDVEGVLSGLAELQKAMAGGGPFSQMSDEARVLLGDLAKTATETARVEAMLNGSAQAEAIKRQIDDLSQGYNQQAQLAQAVLQFGENSAQVEAVRNRHAREGLAIRLQEMGVVKGSAEERRALADLEAAQAADAALSAQRRRQAMADIFTDMRRQGEVSAAILQFGENSAEVEAVRARHANEVLKARLEEMGMLPFLIDLALKLAGAERDRASAIKNAAAQRAASDMLGDLREEAAINAAIAQYGEDSLHVKELQIAAERRAFEQTLATMEVSAAMKNELRFAWEAAKGLASADPFGTIAAGRDYARSQQERIERLRLEQGLLGQTEETRTRIIALWEAERDMIREGIDLTSARADEIRAMALEEASLTRSVDRQREAWQKVQSSAEGAIDGIVEKLMGGDIDGALEALASQLSGTLTELAITNPLKNAMLGTNYGTLQDVGGLQGIWGRLTGQATPGAATLSSMGSSVGAMQVTAASVTIAGPGAMQFMAGATGSLGGAAANMPGAPGGWGGPAAEVTEFLRSVATGGGTRPDAISGLNAGFADPLAAMIADAQRLFGQGAVQITSAFRSVERQQQLWDEALRKYGSPEAARKWVAPPGQSRHNFGLAADLNYGSDNVEKWFHQNAGRYGLGFRMGNEPWHIEPQNAAAMMAGSRAGALGPAEAALERFGATATNATTNLGTLGNGFDVFGNALAQGLNGMATGGGQGGISGFFGTLLTGLAGALKIPGFAGGGDHGGGLRIVGENGPELEFTGPSRILDANLTRSILTSRPPVAANSPAPVIQLQPVLVNNTSRQVNMEVEETTDTRGQRQQRFVISDAVGEGLATPGGKAARNMSQVYGVKRPARQRS